MKLLKTNKLAISLLFIVIILSACSTGKDIRTLDSPDKLVHLAFSDEGGILKYQLKWQDQEMIKSSELSLFPGQPVEIISSELRSVDTTWSPVWGQFSEIRDHYNELVFELDVEGSRVILVSRAYDQGVGFRFEMAQSGEGDSATLYCEFNLANENKLYCPAGEKEPLGPLTLNELTTDSPDTPGLTLPLVVENSNGNFLSILESDLFAAEGFQVMALHFDQKKEILVSLVDKVLKDINLFEKKNTKVGNVNHPVTSQVFDTSFLSKPLIRKFSKIHKIDPAADIKIGYIAIHACLGCPAESAHIDSFAVRPDFRTPI